MVGGARMDVEAANAAAALQPGETSGERRSRLLSGMADGSLAATGLTRLDLSGLDLAELPDGIGTLSTLQFLNLGKNPLSALPATFVGLTSLRILFFLGCEFTAVPELLGRMPSLYMLSFKANKVREVPAASLSPTLGWLILSDNQIERLPDTIGACVGMRKLLLAGNRLTSEGLPESMANMRQLELLRLADNRLDRVPGWILSHPTLAWVALAANPATAPWAESAEARAAATVAEGGGAVEVPEVAFHSLGVDASDVPLGSGASGAVYAGQLDGAPAAVKVYSNGAKTSDGRPQDEMAASVLASRTGCRSIVRSVARFVRAAPGAREGAAEGLVMEFLSPNEWASLGGPPSFDTVTRDTYPPGTSRTAAEVIAVARGVAAAAAALHASGVMHGDLYAHNTLFRSSVVAAALLPPTVPAAKLGDFGAAFFYPPGSDVGRELERAEVRAYGIMLKELLAAHDRVEGAAGGVMMEEVAALAEVCVGARESRPSFTEIVARVGSPEGV